MLILYNFSMNTFEKIKKMILIALGFGLATYLIMSGMAMLDVENDLGVETNTSGKVHTNTMK